jgi:hypothetical protein
MPTTLDAPTATAPPGYLVKWDWWAFPGLWAFDAEAGVEGALADDPPLSAELLGQLSRWVSDGDGQGRGDTLAVDHELVEWNRRGRALAVRVRAEVPAEIPVWWFDEVTGKCVPVTELVRR